MFLLGLFFPWLIYHYIRSWAIIFFYFILICSVGQEMSVVEMGWWYTSVQLSLNLFTGSLWSRTAHCFGCDGMQSKAFLPEHHFIGLDDALLLWRLPSSNKRASDLRELPGILLSKAFMVNPKFEILVMMKAENTIKLNLLFTFLQLKKKCLGFWFLSFFVKFLI